MIFAVKATTFPGNRTHLLNSVNGTLACHAVGHRIGTDAPDCAGACTPSLLSPRREQATAAPFLLAHIPCPTVGDGLMSGNLPTQHC